MHFWIDKTSLNRRDFYSYGVGRNKFIHKQLHHQRSRQNLNPQIVSSNASPPPTTHLTPHQPLVRHYQWLTIYVRSAVCITLLLILLVAKLYYDVMLSKVQLICFCIISVIFLLCTITASLFHIKPDNSRAVIVDTSNSCGLVIDELPPPEYCDVVELAHVHSDRPPSYDKLFEA